MSDQQDRETIWRYMPFEQFVRMLQTRMLWVSQASSFEDKLEGTLPIIALDLNSNEYQIIRERTIQQYKNTFVSCWHSANSESLAMWRLYGKHKFSVVIQSEWMRIVRSIEPILDPYMGNVGFAGKICYLNPSSMLKEKGKLPGRFGIPMGWRDIEFPKFLDGLYLKSKAFEYEKEFRFSFIINGNINPGIEVPIDPEYLISCVYVSPEADDWMLDMVQRLVHQQFQFHKIDVRQSDLVHHFQG